MKPHSTILRKRMEHMQKHTTLRIYLRVLKTRRMFKRGVLPL